MSLMSKHINHERKSITVDNAEYVTSITEEETDRFCSATFQSIKSKLGIAFVTPTALLMGDTTRASCSGVVCFGTKLDSMFPHKLFPAIKVVKDVG